MAKLTGSHVLVRALKQEGIKKIFTIVGDTILPLVDAVEDEGLEFIDTRHEAAAMHMADAWCRVTGEPAVAMFTGGPGFSNAISALPNIYTSESPVVFITGAAELPEKGMYAFQEIDQVEIAAPMSKGSWLVHDRRRIADYVATAFRTAMGGRPGPVHLTIPLDVQEADCSEDDLPGYTPGQYRNRGRSHGDPALVREAVQMLASASKPVIIAANAARYSVSTEGLQELVEATGIPVFTVEQARGLVSDDHPLCFGYADGALNATARRFREADTVLLLGKRFDHRYRYGQPPYFDGAANIIQVDPSPAEIGRNRGVSVGIVGDIGAVVEQLTQEAGKAAWSPQRLAPWVDQLRQDRQAWKETLEANASDELPLHPMKVFREIEHLTDDDSFIIFDGGDYAQWGRSYMRARKTGHWMRLGPLSHLGCGLPYALAAKLAQPDSKVFLFIGDGSIGFYAMEFDTAVRHNLPITVVMGNDSAWGIDKNFQLAYYGRAVATDLRFVGYEKIVETLGGYGEYVEQPADVAPAVGRALASGKPSLVNIRIRSAQSPLADAMVARRLSSRTG
ncbi:MAG: thiamine pyrophosphate-binding protein [Dehalococcoidia bacterium]|nr:thiamine pyrophosphate-binding protein [Dehalococcoidia bacterium]